MSDEYEIDELPEPINATDFMYAVIAHTPHAKLINGPVSVEVILEIDEQGGVRRIEAKHPDPDIRAAAGEACRVLRFKPATYKGEACGVAGYGITIGFVPDPESLAVE